VYDFESSADCVHWSIFLYCHLLKGLLTISFSSRQHQKHNLMLHHVSSHVWKT